MSKHHAPAQPPAQGARMGGKQLAAREDGGAKLTKLTPRKGGVTIGDNARYLAYHIVIYRFSLPAALAAPKSCCSPGPEAPEGQKQAACDVLYGQQNWDAIREAAERDARNGAFPPKQLERIGIKQLE